MLSVIQVMKQNESFNVFKRYFNHKIEEELKGLVSLAGSLTSDELVRANQKFEIYNDLMNLENTIKSELKYN